jgi:fumarate reductase flavoprotein subunit
MRGLRLLFLLVFILPVFVQCADELPSSPYQFKAGTYDGNGEDTFNDADIVMRVTVDKTRIKSITTVEPNPVPTYTELAFKRVPEAIIKKQSVKVDVISGATATSKGIIAAVTDALRKAGATDKQLGVE